MIRISLKNKLFIGFGFLFFMIILLWIIGCYFIYDLSDRSSAMLEENYQTVKSAKILIRTIDDINKVQTMKVFSFNSSLKDSTYSQSLLLFQENLKAVENNITEPGEMELINELKTSYNLYLKTFEQCMRDEPILASRFFSEVIPAYTITRNQIISLSDLNMNAISYKNSLLKNTANRAFLIMSVIGTICFIISALFFFRYPNNVTRPILQLTRGIKEIANRNYEQKLLFKSNDELGELAEAFNTMAARLNEYEHSNWSQILFEKKRIDTIINNMKDAIIGLNDKKEIIFSNTVACQILGIESSELTGKYAPDIAAQNDTFHQIIKDIISGEYRKGKGEFSSIKISSGGKPDYFSKEILDVEIIRTAEIQPVNVGVVIILKNITRFLEQDEAKTNFISIISHELKTPISSIRLNLKLLEDPRIGTLNGEQTKIAGAIKQETSKMLAITKELLDLAQIESGNIRLNIQHISPDQILEYVKETSNNQAKHKQIKVEFESDPNIPFIYADSEKTAWVLLNLINNAIQYSETGSRVLVKVSYKGNEIVFMVQDFGKGIEKKYLDKIFEKFFRIPGSSEKGTGLGLAISKEFITKQRGQIWADSEPGAGSRFYISLPVHLSHELKEKK